MANFMRERERQIIERNKVNRYEEATMKESIQQQ